MNRRTGASLALEFVASPTPLTGASTAAYDAVNFYGTTHKFAKTGSNSNAGTAASPMLTLKR